MCSCMYDRIFCSLFLKIDIKTNSFIRGQRQLKTAWSNVLNMQLFGFYFFFHVMYLVSVDYVFLRTPYRFQRFPVQMKKGQLKYKDESSVTQHTAQRCKSKSHDISPSTKLDAIYYLLTCYDCARLQAIEVALEKEKTHSDETSRKKSILSVISSLFFPVSVNMQDGLLLLLFFLS